jgi:hypothetical protein
MSADSVPSSKTNIFQNKLIYCRHFRTYSRCAMFDWSDTVFRRRNVTRRCISNTVLQPRYWGREADSPEVCRLRDACNKICKTLSVVRFIAKSYLPFLPFTETFVTKFVKRYQLCVLCIFGRIKQIHHVRSWKRQTKGIIHLTSVLNNIRCN